MSDDWVMFYYANPRPERFVEEVRRLAESGAMTAPARSLANATFLGRVMAANPSRVAEWLAALDGLSAEATQTLQIAAWMSDTQGARAWLADAPRFARAVPDVLAAPIHDPAMLDAMWAYYFATGDARPVRRVVSALEHMSDYGAIDRFRQSAQTDEDRRRAMNDAIFRAASWSLGSLMQQHPPLLALCEGLFETAELAPTERLALAITLQKVAPTRWRVDIDQASGQSKITRLGGSLR